MLRGARGAVAKPEELPSINLDKDFASLAQFRAYMNCGTTMTAHGRFRAEFYAKFVDCAQKVVRVLTDSCHGGVAYCISALPLCEAFINHRSALNTEVLSVSVSPSYPDANKFPPITSFKGLENIIRNSPPDSPTPSRDFMSKLQSAQQSAKKTVNDDEPLVVVEADEAHTMTMRRSHPPHEWFNFGQFRRAMRSMNPCSLFSLFLSTTGKITQFITYRPFRAHCGCNVTSHRPVHGSRF